MHKTLTTDYGPGLGPSRNSVWGDGVTAVSDTLVMHDEESLPALAGNDVYLDQVLPVQPSSLCGESCWYANDNECDDGGLGFEFTACPLGSDCTDCGIRTYVAPPPPAITSLVNLCAEACNFAADGDCDDGGSGSEFSSCTSGSDCTDCGPRTPPPPPITYSKTPMMGPLFTEFVKRGGFGSAQGLGFASCQFLRHCDQPGEMVGSPCSATISNVAYTGYCFPSDTGSIECGRLTAMDDDIGSRPFVFDSAMYPTVQPAVSANSNVTVIPSTPGTTMKAYRCPVLSPAKVTGTYVSARLLAAGCMVPTDDNYDLLADVHVPSYCAVPQDLLPGCMLASAVNYDPAAKQSGHCIFRTPGCTSSAAVNYNSEATEDDGSCIARVDGCTVAASYYAGVDPDTPVFGATVGTGGFDGRVAVLNPSTAANVNSGCIIAIEGCMDPSGVNYDSRANVQTTTICLPVVPGCMMPSAAAAASGANLPFGGGVRDGLSLSYDPAATVHSSSACSVARYGCMTPTALNYDETATATSAAYPCYALKYGCLNALAVNYGCEQRGDTSCSVSVTQVTVHNPTRCKYQGEPPDGTPSPPSPPPPQQPTGMRTAAVVTYSVQVEVLVSGSASALASNRGSLIGAWATRYGATPPWTLNIVDPATGTSYRRLQDAQETARLTFERTYESAAAADEAQEAVSSTGVSLADMTAVFSSIPGVDITPLTGGSVETVSITTYVEVDPSSSSDSAMGAIIGGAAGGALALICLVGVVVWRKKRKLRLKIVDA